MTPSPSGNEDNIIKKVSEHLRKYVDNIYTDNYGNLIAVKKGASKKKLMLVAHADEVGLMVTYIDNNGFLSFKEIGSIDTNILPGQRVEIHNHHGIITGVVGKKPIHIQDRNENVKNCEAEDLWIDIAVKSKKEAEQVVEIGDYVTFQTQPICLTNDTWISKALDDKVGLLILIEVAKTLEGKLPAMDIYFVVSVQEELGARGVRTATIDIGPDFGIAIDVTHAVDYPTCSPQKNGEIKIGEGIVIAKGPNISRNIERKMLDLAQSQNIKYQIEPIARPTGTDANFIQISGKGVKTALLSIPCRYMHSPNEMALADIKEGVSLLTHLCEVELDN